MNSSQTRKFRCIGPRAARYARLGGTLALALLAGCASQATRDADRSTTRGDKESASQLYAGQPAVVHATEFPVTSAAEGVQRGDQAWRDGKLDLAVYLYVQSLAYDATLAGPFLKIGAIHERLGNRELAQKAFEFALQRDPMNAAACERLGHLYLQSNRDGAAEALFERAIAMDPDRWQSHNGLGILADRRSDYAAALDYYNKASVLAPNAATVVNNRGYSRYLAGDLRGAENDLLTAIRMDAPAGTWINLGKVQAAQARYDEALKSFMKEADLPNAYNCVGEIAMKNANYAAAKKFFTSAISASPRYFEVAQKNLALVNERLSESASGDRRIAQSATAVAPT